MALLVLCAGLFSAYVWSEKKGVDQANDLRQRSHLLADELRQSSDDLTRMARTCRGQVISYKKIGREVIQAVEG